MHSSQTLQLLETATSTLGERLRAFVEDTCPAFKTRELKREVDARHRRESGGAKKVSGE
jgi:hypothetical protein